MNDYEYIYNTKLKLIIHIIYNTRIYFKNKLRFNTNNIEVTNP